MARRSMDLLIESLLAHVENKGSLTFEVEENLLVWEGEPVYSYDTSRDNLAFLMYRDGVRSLSLHPGIDAAEVESLTDCLAHADDLADIEYDLVTAFWERDFSHIDYKAADPFLGGEVLREGTIDTLRETVLRRLEEVDAIAAPGEGPTREDLRVVEPITVDRSSLALTPEELERSERLIEGPSDALEDFAQVLLEIAGSSSVSALDEVFTQSLAAVIASYVHAKDLEGGPRPVKWCTNLSSIL